jgi:hypothetical protein
MRIVLEDVADPYLRREEEAAQVGRGRLPVLLLLFVLGARPARFAGCERVGVQLGFSMRRSQS